MFLCGMILIYGGRSYSVANNVTQEDWRASLGMWIALDMRRRASGGHSGVYSLGKVISHSCGNIVGEEQQDSLNLIVEYNFWWVVI